MWFKKKLKTRYSISKYVGILGALLAFVVFELSLIMSASEIAKLDRERRIEAISAQASNVRVVTEFGFKQFAELLSAMAQSDELVEAASGGVSEVFFKGRLAQELRSNFAEVSFWVYNANKNLVYSDGEAAATEAELDLGIAYNGGMVSGAAAERGRKMWFVASPIASPYERDQIKGVLLAGLSLKEKFVDVVRASIGFPVALQVGASGTSAALELPKFPGFMGDGVSVVWQPPTSSSVGRFDHVRGFAMAFVTAILFGLFSAVASSLIVAKPIRKLLKRGRQRASQRFSIEEFDLLATEIEGKGAQLDREISLRGGVVRALSEGFQLVNERGLTLDVNPSLCKLVGIPREQFLGRMDPFFYLDEEGRSRSAEFMEMLRLDDCMVRIGFDCSIPMPEGQENCDVAVRMCLVSKDTKGHFTFAVLVVDRTFERRQELRSQRSDKAKLIGQMAAGVAHNINNLLTSMIGATSLLERVTVGNESVPRLIAAIKESATQGALLTKELQQLALVNDGVSLRTPIDTSSAIQDVVRIARGYPEAAHIDFKLDLPNGPVLALCEEGGLNQVLLNLVTNAIDAIQENTGAIIVSAENVERAHGLVARISVTDSGAGIHPDIKAKLFEPFFSTKKRTTAGGKGEKKLIGGSGLGLSSAYALIQSWGGEIEVKSEPGKGSTFTVELPAARASSTSSDRLKVIERLKDSSSLELSSAKD
jgi:nitrogen-specific signal transduction histidine kinase